MAEEIKSGDWISYPEGVGKVIDVDEDGYGVHPQNAPRSSVLVPKGDRVKKIAPPDED